MSPMSPFMWTIRSVVDEVHYSDNMHKNLKTLKPLLDRKQVSVAMAKKIAGSGLTYGHLQCVFGRGGSEELEILLRSQDNGKVRVTKKDKIISNICKHFLEI